MSYKTIAVNLSDIDRVPALLKCANMLCKKYDAHLIGLHVIPPVNLAISSGPFGISPEIVEQYVKERDKNAKEIENIFKSYMEKESLSNEWVCIGAWKNWSDRHLIKHARCADLIVSDQGDTSSGFSEQTKITEHLILEAGRPVLVIPVNDDIQSIGDYPLIAWNASREATRAVFDALPLLKQSKEVNVIWADPNEPDETIDIAGSEIATTLARHGLNVEAGAIQSEHNKPGETILEAAKEKAADLLVMGAYGHSRLQEFLLGGATRTVLKTMTLPVLFAQ